MASSDEHQSKTNLRISFMLLISIMISIVAIAGWILTRNEYLELKSDNDAREALVPAAARQALEGLSPNLVGKPIDDYPIIQVLDTQSTVSPVHCIEEFHENRKYFTFPDVYGNDPVHWEKIDRSKDLTIYSLRLGQDKERANSDYGVGIVVQDGIIRMVIEFDTGTYQGAESIYGFFGG